MVNCLAQLSGKPHSSKRTRTLKCSHPAKTLQWSKQQAKMLIFKAHSFLWAPVTTFWYSVLFYCSFLTLLSYTLTVRFEPAVVEWNEILVCVWVAGFFLEWLEKVSYR